MERFIHRVQLIEALQFEPALLPWPEGVRLREDNRFELVWPEVRGQSSEVRDRRAPPEPIYPGDYIVFRGGIRFAVYRQREFEKKFARVEVTSWAQDQTVGEAARRPPSAAVGAPAAGE